MRHLLFVTALVLAPLSVARAATTTSSIGTGQRALAVGAAVVPGVLVHGSGHFVAGDTDTAVFLLGIEGLGLAGVLSGLVGLAVTGASTKTVVPLTALTIGGAGLFITSFLADLYGVIAPGIGARTSAVQTWPIETRFGLLYVADRTFEYGVVSNWALAVRTGDWRFEPEVWVALDDDNARVRGEIAYRLTGDAASFLDLGTALTHHHYGTHAFAITTAEIFLDSRYALRRLAPSLDGAFVQAGLGLALEGHRFFDRASQSTSLLVGGFGFGTTFTDGEAALYYDHRHDGYAAGLKVAGLGSGVAGHFGIRGAWYWSDFGAGVFAETGSAHLVGVSLRYRGGQ